MHSRISAMAPDVFDLFSTFTHRGERIEPFSADYEIKSRLAPRGLSYARWWFR